MIESSPAERNARNRACKRYLDWLYSRYQRLDVVELAADDPSLADPISLRQIYVPLRIAAADIDDEAMGDGRGKDIDSEALPGRDAFDVLCEDRFVLLSGRPGSGKSTLVQALIVELCGEHPSSFRRRLPAVPVPFILRTFDDFDTIERLDDLIAAWWPIQLAQAEKDGLPLDQNRLHATLFEPNAERRDLPVLFLFDGIDEIGGPGTRQRLYEIACEARGRGYRVLVTGRPAGFADLTIRPGLASKARDGAEVVASPLRHVLPFGWGQIESFIDAWYGLRKDWLRDRDVGMKRFLDHLRAPEQRQLLTLARRPIFITLMALVNCTQSEMPQGRARLYRMILDLYLNRQERHRQRLGALRPTTSGCRGGLPPRRVWCWRMWLGSVKTRAAESKVNGARMRAGWSGPEVSSKPRFSSSFRAPDRDGSESCSHKMLETWSTIFCIPQACLRTPLRVRFSSHT